MTTVMNVDQQAKKAAGKAEEPTTMTSSSASVQAIDPLVDLLNRAEKAYSAYLDAQRDVVRTTRLLVFRRGNLNSRSLCFFRFVLHEIATLLS